MIVLTRSGMSWCKFGVGGICIVAWGSTIAAVLDAVEGISGDVIAMFALLDRR